MLLHIFIGKLIVEVEQKGVAHAEYGKEGLLTEIILLECFTLCSTISMLNEINRKAIKKITSEYYEHTLLVYLDDKIEKETIVKLILEMLMCLFV